MSSLLTFNKRVRAERAILQALNSSGYCASMLQGLTIDGVSAWINSSEIPDSHAKDLLLTSILEVIKILSGSKVYTSLGQIPVQSKESEEKVDSLVDTVLKLLADVEEVPC